jgi:hypothetical protein
MRWYMVIILKCARIFLKPWSELPVYKEQHKYAFQMSTNVMGFQYWPIFGILVLVSKVYLHPYASQLCKALVD